MLGEIFYGILLALLIDQLSLSYPRMFYCCVRFFKMKFYGKSCQTLWTSYLLISQTGGRRFVGNSRLVSHFVLLSRSGVFGDRLFSAFLNNWKSWFLKKSNWFLSTSVFHVFRINMLYNLKILIDVIFSFYFIYKNLNMNFIVVNFYMVNI